MSRYSLGPVKPHVRAVAESLGPQFGYTTIWGYAYRNIEGTSKLSDHAKGLALDFMSYTNMAQGTSLANHLVANYKQLNVTYVIWNRRIWEPHRGWYAYTGRNPHTDHVHVSFTPTGTYNGPGSNVGGGSDNVSQGGTLDKLQMFTDSRMWLRVAMFIGGVALIFVALLGATGSQLKGIVK